jgi:hypothetical protein
MKFTARCARVAKIAEVFLAKPKKLFFLCVLSASAVKFLNVRMPQFKIQHSQSMIKSHRPLRSSRQDRRGFFGEAQETVFSLCAQRLCGEISKRKNATIKNSTFSIHD